MIAALIFDMDGLLVDSESVWAIAEENLLTRRGFTVNAEVRESLIGLRMDEFMAKMRSAYQMTDSLDALMEELTLDMLRMIPEKVRPQPGANELVQYVAQQGITRAIASSSPLRIIDATLTAKGWDTVFSVRCSADHEKRGKPAPDVYLRAAEKLGVAPQDCLALEDSPNGARAAVAAGMTCYAVPDLSHTQPQAFAPITPHVFGDLHQVLAHMRANGIIS
ncbi:MAG: HAD family phosphatase [Chloroflexi bacterium]|nr:HAD family phosphatase [Chloroflexota bacterium]